MFAIAELLFLLVSPIFRTWLSVLGWGTREGNLFAAHFQETVLACFLYSNPVDGGIVAGLCNQLQDTGEDACGSLGTGARNSPVYPVPREHQSATGLCTRHPAGTRREVWPEMCIGFIPVNIQSWQNT